jgi:hypothetical protein
MKHLKKLGLASAIALIAVCGMAGSASATTIDHVTTPVSLLSTNSVLSVHGSATITCTSSTLTGVTPDHSRATWLQIPGTLNYSGCTAFGFTANITPTESCTTAASQPLVDVMYNHGPPVSVAVVVTLRTCNITINLPALGCHMTVTGNNQSIGNGTAGVGGIQWTNLSTKSQADVSSTLVSNIDSNGAGVGCPSAGGGHTGTLNGTYTINSATNITVTT